MIVKGFRRDKAAEDVDFNETDSKGFDAFELRLGDLMRGERATMGKSLLDVQRELKIKAAYIAAIENCDPSAFDTPGFIAGYVRSYARYLQMEPDWAFETFCRESGFATAHGMSAAASSVKPAREKRSLPQGDDMFASSSTPFVPTGEAVFSQIEPAAVGSVMVLVALIGGLGFGGWSVLQELQRVEFAPVEQTPVVLSDIDPLAGASTIMQTADVTTEIRSPSPEALDRLYRPQALEVPVLVARDAPISTLRPGDFGALAPMSVDEPLLDALAEAEIEPAPTVPTVPQVNEAPAPEVQIMAVRPAWVRIRSADGTVIFEGIMDGGDTFALPATEEPATLRVGESGAVYFAVNGTAYGPAGPRGQVTSDLALSVENLTANYSVADLQSDDDLAKIVNVAEVEAAD